MGRKLIELFFTASCWIIVGIMIGYWFYKYEVEDRDIGVVDYVPLEEANEVEMPMATICLMQPFIEKNIKQVNPSANSTAYLDYLEGNIFEETYHGIDYEKVTLNIFDYFLFATEVWPNESDTNRSRPLSLQHEYVFSGFHSKARHEKCFPLQIALPHSRNIQGVGMTFDRKRLLKDWKNSLNRETRFCLKPHYPWQYFLGLKPECWDWMILKNIKDITIKIEELEVIKRRNTRNKRCADNSNAYDKMLLKKHILAHGCRAPSINLFDSYPICNSTKKISESKMTYGKAKSIALLKPCNRISTIRYTLPDTKLNITQVNSNFVIRIEYPDEIKIISQVKEVDIHTLIGNIGGYFGLFLGTR